jgi:hypothetical protein
MKLGPLSWLEWVLEPFFGSSKSPEPRDIVQTASISRRRSKRPDQPVQAGTVRRRPEGFSRATRDPASP